MQLHNWGLLTVDARFTRSSTAYTGIVAWHKSSGEEAMAPMGGLAAGREDHMGRQAGGAPEEARPRCLGGPPASGLLGHKPAAEEAAEAESGSGNCP